MGNCFSMSDLASGESALYFSTPATTCIRGIGCGSFPDPDRQGDRNDSLDSSLLSQWYRLPYLGLEVSEGGLVAGDDLGLDGAGLADDLQE